MEKEKPIAFVKLECPICHSVRDRLREDVDGIDIWCRDCKQWFELGFQIHSED